MSLISLLVGIVVLGLVFWLLEQLPLTSPWNIIARVVLVVVAIIWLLSFIGVGPGINW